MSFRISPSVISGLAGILGGFLLSAYFNPYNLASAEVYRQPITRPESGRSNGAAARGANEAIKFVASGLLVLSQRQMEDPYWTLVYAQGNKTVTVELEFSKDSLCEGSQGSEPCVPESFINGTKVKVLGIGQGAKVEVLLLAKET
jgi:hypothetical protein